MKIKEELPGNSSQIDPQRNFDPKYMKTPDIAGKKFY